MDPSGMYWWVPLISRCAQIAQTGGATVYQYIQNGVVKYVGITNNFARRSIEQMSQKGIPIEEIPGLQNLSRPDARSVEQVLIEKFGLENLINKINSISPNNPIYEEAIKIGKQILNSKGL